MRFSKISVTNKGVHLVREKRDGNGAVEEIDLTSPERPMPSFADALQGFKPFVRELLDGAVVLEDDNMTITTLNLSEDRNHNRGLIVTATVPVPNAYDKPLVLNSPLVREGAEDASEDACVLTDEVLALIDLAEKEATRYAKGEREKQLDLEIAAESANAKEAGERMTAAAIGSTRKPRRTKGDSKIVGKIGSGEELWNPEKTEPVTTPLLRQLLLSVERDVPETIIEKWTSTERDGAQRWAEARQKELAGQLADSRVPREPACVVRDGTPTLADGWTAKKPAPKVDPAAVDAIQASAGIEKKEQRRGATPRHVQ